jgi:hypothetical protein
MVNCLLDVVISSVANFFSGYNITKGSANTKHYSDNPAYQRQDVKQVWIY